MTDEDGAGPGEEDHTSAAENRDPTIEDTAPAANRGTPDEQSSTLQADREGEERAREEDRKGNVAGTLAPTKPLEPGDIDLENALFVLAGVVLVVGFLVLAIAGL